MKTLYEILEVSENASQEIIEKAYKVLAKKYHPDLQAEENKQEAEKHMKEINEAYEILGDEVKRKEYDAKLERDRQEKEEREDSKRQTTNYSNINYQEQMKTYNNQQAHNEKQRPMTEEEYKEAKRQQQEEIKRQQKMQQEMQKNMQAQYEQKYQEAYEGYLRSLGYKIKYKWTWKNYRDLLITILIIIGICAILWLFPPTNKLMMDFYNSNQIVKTIIDVIGNVFKGIWNAICSIFK